MIKKLEEREYQVRDLLGNNKGLVNHLAILFFSLNIHGV
ncbi:uncharacterized protein METZ01_LOCUS157359 [marine metagenome]|uniref:Uncharacterized protein n=1 Tax=marine metagenome TaxID=408172 RepID=A0A382ASH8_9ZZZZ